MATSLHVLSDDGELTGYKCTCCGKVFSFETFANNCCDQEKHLLDGVLHAARVARAWQKQADEEAEQGGERYLDLVNAMLEVLRSTGHEKEGDDI